MQFSKAAEVSKTRSNVPTPWSSLLPSLHLLAKCENAYLGLEFLESKWLRKDELNGAYSQIVSDLKKTAVGFENSVPLSPPSTTSTATKTTESLQKQPSDLSKWKSELLFMSSLIQNLLSFVTLRQQLISIYRSLATFRRNGNYEEILSEITNINEKFVVNQFNHPYFNFIKLTIQTEVNTLQKLIDTQIKISAYNFKDSVLCLFQCKYEFDMWKHKFATIDQKSESQKLLKSGVYLYHWLSLFIGSLVAKLTFYFSNIFKKTELKIGGDFKNLINKMDIDYFSLVENFIQKSQCYSVCLIYETGGRRIDLEGYSLTVSRKQDVSKLEKRTNALIPTSVHATSSARGSNLTLLQKHTLLSMSPVSVTTPAIITTTTTTPSIASNSKISPSDSSTTLISSRTRTQNTVSGHSTSITTTATTTSEISQNNEEEEQSLTGLKSYPAIFCAPQENPPLEHWPNIVSIIQDNEEVLAKSNREPLFYNDPKLKVTYFVDKVEQHISLVVIFIDKKVKKNEQVVLDFYNNMISCLRNYKILERLLNKQMNK